MLEQKCPFLSLSGEIHVSLAKVAGKSTKFPLDTMLYMHGCLFSVLLLCLSLVHAQRVLTFPPSFF